jgi:hypothetical protein
MMNKEQIHWLSRSRSRKAGQVQPLDDVRVHTRKTCIIDAGRQQQRTRYGAHRKGYRDSDNPAVPHS